MNKRIKNVLAFIIFSLVLISLTTISYAASFTPGISSTNVKVGDTITITVKADNAAGMYNVKVKDSSVLEVISGATSEFLENSSATIKLKAKKAGTTTVSVTPSDMTDLDDSTKPVTAGGKTYTVKVTDVVSTTPDKDTTTDKNTSTTNKDTTTPEKPKEKSNNAYLSTLGVTPKEYDFSGFSKTKTSYSVTVPKNVDSLKVLYKAADSNATVKVSGNSGFEVGSNNKITIKVTAEDGKTTKTYTIKVTKLAEEEEKPGNLIEDKSELYLTSLGIEGLELSPEFTKDTYSYTAKLADNSANEVKVVAEANNENAKIDISGNSNLVEGENTINIVVTLDESSTQAVYQIVVTKEVGEVVDATAEEKNSTTDIIGMFKGYVGIAIGVVALMIIAVIVLVILLVKENKKQDKEEIEDKEDIKAEEYNVYENDENEFENSDVEKDNFIESLYKERNGKLDEEEVIELDKETIEEINKQTEEIFKEKEIKVEGQSVEYTSNDVLENPLEIRRKRRGKGKHSK